MDGPLPPEPAGAVWTIDSTGAAAIVGVGRLTLDRRVKDGVAAGTPGAPRDVSRGVVRSRWRWKDDAAVLAWWTAVK